MRVLASAILIVSLSMDLAILSACRMSRTRLGSAVGSYLHQFGSNEYMWTAAYPMVTKSTDFGVGSSFGAVGRALESSSKTSYSSGRRGGGIKALSTLFDVSSMLSTVAFPGVLVWDLGVALCFLPDPGGFAGVVGGAIDWITNCLLDLTDEGRDPGDKKNSPTSEERMKDRGYS